MDADKRFMPRNRLKIAIVISQVVAIFLLLFPVEAFYLSARQRAIPMTTSLFSQEEKKDGENSESPNSDQISKPQLRRYQGGMIKPVVIAAKPEPTSDFVKVNGQGTSLNQRENTEYSGMFRPTAVKMEDDDKAGDPVSIPVDETELLLHTTTFITGGLTTGRSKKSDLVEESETKSEAENMPDVNENLKEQKIEDITESKEITVEDEKEIQEDQEIENNSQESEITEPRESTDTQYTEENKDAEAIEVISSESSNKGDLGTTRGETYADASASEEAGKDVNEIDHISTELEIKGDLETTGEETHLDFSATEEEEENKDVNETETVSKAKGDSETVGENRDLDESTLSESKENEGVNETKPRKGESETIENAKRLDTSASEKEEDEKLKAIEAKIQIRKQQQVVLDKIEADLLRKTDEIKRRKEDLLRLETEFANAEKASLDDGEGNEEASEKEKIAQIPYYSPKEYKALSLEEKVKLREARAAIKKADKSSSEGAHPLLGPVVVDLGYKRVHVVSSGRLGTIPIWKKQRTFRYDRVKRMAAEKQDNMHLGFPGIICLNEDAEGKLSIIDGQHRVGMMQALRESRKKLKMEVLEGNLEGEQKEIFNEQEEYFQNVLVEVYSESSSGNVTHTNANDCDYTTLVFQEINKAKPMPLKDV